MDERQSDGPCGVIGDQNAHQYREKGTDDGDSGAPVEGVVTGFFGFVRRLLDLFSGLVEKSGRLDQPGRRVFLEIENLQVGNGGIAGIDLMALGEKRL